MQTISRRALAVLVAILFLATATAGCYSSTEGRKSFTVPKDAGSVGEQRGSQEPFELVIRVTDVDTGEPVEGAAVVFFEAVHTGDAFFFFFTSHTEYQALAAARTDADGIATGLLQPGGTIFVGVGDVSDRTNEIRAGVPIGESGGSSSLEIPLYATVRSVSETATLDLRATHPGSQVGLEEPERLVVPLSFSDDEDVSLGYTERLHTFELTVRWNNSLPDYADLYAGLRTPDGDVEWRGTDERQQPASSELEERLEVSSAEFDEHRKSFAETGLELEALTDEPVVTLDGIRVTFEASATFKASDLEIES